MRQVFYILCIVYLISCNNTSTIDKEAVKKQIIDTEKSFEKMAAEKGISEAFWFYADSNAVISRQNDTLIKGKEAIKNYYSSEFYQKASVNWKADFVEVSENGDMAYTYGRYNWKGADTSGKPVESTGIFHTVWKKQEDGSWKYVWD